MNTKLTAGEIDRYLDAMARAFVQIGFACWNGDTKAAEDIAHAFHNKVRGSRTFRRTVD
jgi:hypothetical protein